MGVLVGVRVEGLAEVLGAEAVVSVVVVPRGGGKHAIQTFTYARLYYSFAVE